MTDMSHQDQRVQHNELWLQTAHDMQHWSGDLIVLSQDDKGCWLKLVGTATRAVTTDATTGVEELLDGARGSYDSETGLWKAEDPWQAGTYQEKINYYNGGSFYYGTLVSPVYNPQTEINTLIVSWNAGTPEGTWLQLHVRVQQAGIWTGWYRFPVWASETGVVQRHSINSQRDATGMIATDTFRTQGQDAQAYQIGITLCSTNPAISPRLRRIAVLAAYNTETAIQSNPVPIAWGQNLPVPARSQMKAEYQGKEYGGGGSVWCSPTSTTMVMAYWSDILHQPQLVQSVPDAARQTYDYTYNGTGNWPFNTAYAGTYGLCAFVTQMSTFSQVEEWIRVGVPIIISISWAEGELSNAPIPHSDGHIIVIRGFTEQGDVIVNDPAQADDEAVACIYPRAELERLWLRSAHGLSYVIFPEGWQTPERHGHGSW